MEKWEHFIHDIDSPTSQDYDSYIWGAGNTAALAHQGMIRHHLYEKFNVVAYLDKEKEGSTLNGFQVLNPNILKKVDKNTTFVLICTQNKWMLDEIETYLRDEGIHHSTLDEAIILYNYNSVIEAAKLFDEESREIYYKLMENRLKLEDDYSSLYAGESYFGIPQFCRPRSNDVILECGAYVGDSTERFVWRMNQFEKIIAIEPDPSNYNALKCRLSRLRKEWNIAENRLIPIHGGVDYKTSSMFLKTMFNGLCSYGTNMPDENSQKVVFWAIDDLTAHLHLQKQITYIKADVESYEYRMLLGARKTIIESKPRLAICIYHNAVDMFSIPLLIKSINPDYKFAVRHHSYGYEESVLYAY